MKKLIFEVIIAIFCGWAALEFIDSYYLTCDRIWLVFSAICLVCFALGVFSAVSQAR